MASAVRVKVEGLKELDKALGELTKATARNTLRRALIAAGEPMRARAAANAPVRTGQLRQSIKISSRVDNRAGKREYAATLAGGGTKAQAVQALRDARRAKGIGESFAEVFIGPERGSKRLAIKSIVQEFGNSRQTPRPYMRPAFDSEAGNVLGRVRSELSREIDKAVSRARAKALKKAAKV